MPEPQHQPERPPDEAWWERELNRNEKLMDKYMAALGDDPDKFKNPRDLYNKVHFDIDPPEYPAEEDDEETTSEIQQKLDELFDEDEEFGPAENETESPQDAVEFDEDADDPFDNEPPDNEDYPVISKIARKFAVSVMRMEDIPDDSEVLYLSAGKVGANLAGGHGIGYDDDAICGNIVKCKWALADCEFCREMLGHLHDRTGDARYDELRRDAQELSTAIRDRIARLRKRVWW
ncbi:MAG TPA: hypothetical protein VFB72_20380 [Verrucomicrobiae bacterium]|nr:hypothetical protein [Verrucomicrobiae bacterium]